MKLSTGRIAKLFGFFFPKNSLMNFRKKHTKKNTNLMDELKDTKLMRPMDKGLDSDTAALNALCSFLNNPAVTGAEVPKGESTKIATDLTGATIVPTDVALTSVTKSPIAKPPITSAGDFSRVFYTGRICAGKDFIAARTGSATTGFSEPILRLAELFFPGLRPDADGLESWIQIVGAWGKGYVSAAYPITPMRALFIFSLKGMIGHESLDSSVNWQVFGSDANIWLKAALLRLNATQRNAITSVHYDAEFKHLISSGWVNWHVMTTPGEWTARLVKKGLKPESPVVKSDSEALATRLDNQVVKEISQNRNGRKLRVIWNSDTPPPSPRLWTVAEFLKSANIVPEQTSVSDIVLV